MIIKNYKEFLIKEDIDQLVDDSSDVSVLPTESIDTNGGNVTLYRLTSHPVVDLSEPGEYYVKSLEDVSPDFLDNKGDEYFLITVNCPSDNIDDANTEVECAKHNCDCIVAVKDDKRCEIVTVEPWKK